MGGSLLLREDRGGDRRDDQPVKDRTAAPAAGISPAGLEAWNRNSTLKFSIFD
jgi:hypothetical protein